MHAVVVEATGLRPLGGNQTISIVVNIAVELLNSSSQTMVLVQPDRTIKSTIITTFC